MPLLTFITPQPNTFKAAGTKAVYRVRGELELPTRDKVVNVVPKRQVVVLRLTLTLTLQRSILHLDNYDQMQSS